MATFYASTAAMPSGSIVKTENKWRNQIKHKGPVPAGLSPIGAHSLRFERKRGMSYSTQVKHASMTCSASLNARCAEGQTQTVTRDSSTITVAPTKDTTKSPDLDDGGTGFPPRDDDGGGGGGGGGGGKFSGGFFFFGLLAFLGFLKDQESEGPYQDDRRRLRKIRFELE